MLLERRRWRLRGAGCGPQVPAREALLGRQPLTPLAQHGPSTYYLVYGQLRRPTAPTSRPPNAGSSASQPINYDYADAARDDTEWTRQLIATASFTGNHAHRGPELSTQLLTILFLIRNIFALPDTHPHLSRKALE